MKERFENIVIYMLTSDVLAPYANILAKCYIYEHNQIPTIGVRIVDRNVEILYNKDFIESLSDKQLIFILLHEIYHIMFHHTNRESQGSNHEIANKVQDAIINDSLLEDNILRPYYEKPVSETTQEFSGVTLKSLEEELGTSYKGIPIFESMYIWYKNNAPNIPSPTTVQVEGDGDVVIESQDGFDTHLQDNCTEEEAKIVSGDIINSLKSRGCLPLGLEKLLKGGMEKQVDYLKVIKKVISNHLLHGIKKKTFSRPHVYGIEGLKGNIYRQYQINCILDTSGSMSSDIEYVLSFLYKNKVTVTLIQIDTEIQSIKTFKNTKAIYDVPVKGWGGTILQPAIEHISQDKDMRKYCNLILTDGWTDTLDFKNINRPTLIISTDTKCDVINDNNRVKQLIIKR